MTARCLFPPETREGQFDEKWSFVGKKEKKCNPDDPADERMGDNWDHVAFDPEHRLVPAAVPGKRTAENAEKAVTEFQKRTDGSKINLITSDEYRPYKTAILNIYGNEVIPPRTGKRGRPKNPYTEPPENINYATVHKTRENGRVVKIEYRTVFGTDESIRESPEKSSVSSQINTAFIERNNGTDRNRNGRKVRKTCCFSKNWDIHEAVTYFTMYSYNFCWEVRTLRKHDGRGTHGGRTPAMAAGLTDHVWSLREWLTYPSVQWK
ncbi:MAG: IS1 family transposase [Desulfococcaceae bacterium]